MRPRHTTPPQSLDPQNMVNYPNHQVFKQEGKTAVIAYMGQLYSVMGRKLPHDPEFLSKGNYTMVPEMANIILQRVERESKTCPSCGFTKLMANAKFCSTCGHQQESTTEIVKDDRLISMLKNLNPDNPFLLANGLQQRDSRAPTPDDFMTKEDVQRIISESFQELKFVQGVPGEGAVSANPSLDTNPFADVQYTASGTV